MNTILLKGSDLEINAYLNNLSLHQSFEEEDTEEDEILNPSGSVLQPASNPYNKQRKIAEANETLFAQGVTPKSPQRVKFNKVEKRICYDYFGSSFESDSIKSYEDEESEREGLLHANSKHKDETILDLKGNLLQLQTPASKVVVTVSPRREEEPEEHSESESEDVCVGTVTKTDETVENTNTGRVEESVTEIIEQIEETRDSEETDRVTEIEEIQKPSNVEKEEVVAQTSAIENKQTKLENTNTSENKSKRVENRENNNKSPISVDLEKRGQKFSSSFTNSSDFYTCLNNHSGITIRITGADSIESVESESTDNEVQIIDNYNHHDTVELRDSSFSMSKINQNYKTQETTYKVTKQTFILKGIKTTQNMRVPKQNKKIETGAFQRSCTKKERSEKVLNLSKQNLISDKTDQSTTKVEKHSSRKKSNKDLSLKSKSLEDKINSETDDCFFRSRKARPKSCVEKESEKIKPSLRPVTAPAKRSCCQWGQPHLPEYNGLRSEYGLSAEQLMERKRHKMEALKMQKQRKEQKCMEEQQKRQENEAKFVAWLENKRKQAQMQFLRNQRLQAESGIKIYPAPTAHLKRTGAVRSRKLFKSQRKCVSLEEILSGTNSHENKTYRIYLGLSFD